MDLPVKNFSFFGKFFLSISIFLFSGMIYFAIDTVRFLSGSIEAEGYIADYVVKKETDSDGKYADNYYPRIEYKDMKGVKHSFMSDSVMNFEVDVYIKGKASGFTNPVYPMPVINVRYNPENPSLARVSRNFADLWGSSVAYAILSIIFALVGGGLLLVNRKNGN